MKFVATKTADQLDLQALHRVRERLVSQRTEPHVGSGDRLANRVCVSHVVLLPFDVGLKVSRRHQSYGMAKCLSPRDQR
jgi:hypothetical protein